MTLTDAMRAYARKSLGVPPDGDDNAIRTAIGAALVDERLTKDVWEQLKANKTVDGRQVVTQLIDERLTVVKTELVTEVKGLLAGIPGYTAPTSQGTTGGSGGTSGGQGNGSGGQGGKQDEPDEVEKRLEALLVKHGLTPVARGGDGTTVSPTQLLARGAVSGWLTDGTNVRVKSPLERYSGTKKEARWDEKCKHVALRGQRVTFPAEGGPGFGRPLDHASDQDKAIAGAWFKWQTNLTNPGGELPRWTRLTDHDWDLIRYALHELPFTGMIGGLEGTAVDGQKLGEVRHRGVDGIKAVLDDSTSGGIQAAPIVIEDQLILIPLLYGELFPRIPVINIPRGRRIHAATLGTPTFTSGIPEGTPIPLFDTTNFLGAFDTNIFTAVGAMEIGLDFEEDTPADIGGTILTRYGQAALQWLDRVPALGDGVTEPLGFFNAAGIVVVASVNGTTGPLTVADAEGLMFGLAKQYRTTRGGMNVFVGNETTYRRFRNVPLGSGWGNSRAFGDNYGDYKVLGYDYAVIPLVPNNWAAFCNIAYYRMYRRLGLTTRVETAGRTLALANTKLLVMRMRWGGAPEQGGAFCQCSDFPL